MAEEGSLHLRVQELEDLRPLDRPMLAASISQPGRLERLLTGLTLFLLAFNLPSDWLRNQATSNRADLNLGGSAEILALFLVLFVLAFLRLMNNGQFVFDLFKRELFLVTFLAWIALSTVWSAEPDATLRRSVALILTTGFAAYLVIRFRRSEIIILAATTFAVGTILSYIFVFALPSSGTAGSGWIGIFVNKNLLGRHEVLACVLYLLAAAVSRRHRLFFSFMAVLSLILVVGSGSATSLISLIVLFGNYLVFRFFRARRLLFGAVVITFMASAAAAIGIVYTNLAAVTRLFGKDVTFTGRTELWEYSLNASLERIWLGWGWDAYWRGFLSPSHESWVQMPWLPPHAHNAFIDYLLVIGIPGAVLFILVLGRAVVRAARLIREAGTTEAMFPLLMLAYGFLFSLTEAGVVGRHARWVLFAVAIFSVASGEMTQTSQRVSSQTRGVAQPSPPKLRV